MPRRDNSGERRTVRAASAAYSTCAAKRIRRGRVGLSRTILRGMALPTWDPSTRTLPSPAHKGEAERSTIRFAKIRNFAPPASTLGAASRWSIFLWRLGSFFGLMIRRASQTTSDQRRACSEALVDSCRPTRSSRFFDRSPKYTSPYSPTKYASDNL